MRLIILITTVLLAPAATADVYRWVDETGGVQFGDRPPAEGAEAVELLPANTFVPRPLPSVEKGDQAGGDPAPSTVPYTRVKVLQPAADATIRDNTGRVDLEVSLDPPLQPGHRMAVLVDDRTVFDQLTVTQVALTNVERGTHSLQVKVLDADGAQLSASAPVTFHLHRASALTPRPAPRR